MITISLKKKGYPITKEIGKVKEMLFTKHYLYIKYKDDNDLLRSTGIDLTIYNVIQVRGKENE